MKILVLDDYEPSAIYLKESIEEQYADLDYKVVIANNYSEARAEINSPKDGILFDWCIIDIELCEDLCGLDFALYVNYKSPLSRLIIYSGKDLTAEWANRMREINCTFLPKPVTQKDIIEKLNEAGNVKDKNTTNDTKLIERVWEHETMNAVQNERLSTVECDLKALKRDMNDGLNRVYDKIDATYKAFEEKVKSATKTIGVVMMCSVGFISIITGIIALVKHFA